MDPSTHGRNGQDRKGRFTRGNRLGRGNPLAGRAAKIRAMLLKASTPEDVKVIAQRLIEGAKAGDLAFIREWLDRTIGKAHQELTHHVDNSLSLTTDAERDAENLRLLADLQAALSPSSSRSSAN
jgi:hypothetical protein